MTGSKRSEEQDLPWIDVGEMDGWDGETAKAYGVQFVPKSYLVDRERTILQKDLNPDELEEVYRQGSTGRRAQTNLFRKQVGNSNT